MATILITGGAGFIGSHTADALVAVGHRVKVLDILDPQVHGNSQSFPSYMHPAVECIRGDVTNLSDVMAALEGVDVVYHMAALTGVGQSMYDMANYVRVNCTGTAVLIEAILRSGCKLKRFVLSSSRAVYGEGTHRCEGHGDVFSAVRQRDAMEAGRFGVYCPDCGEETTVVATIEARPLNPVSVYAYTKKHQEELCEFASKTFQLPVTILRYFNVYGSRQSLLNPYTGIVSIFYSRIMAGKAVSLYEHGNPVRDFVHIEDVVQANLKAVNDVIPSGSKFNVGSGVPVTVLDVVNAIGELSGGRVEMIDRGEFRIGDIHACYADLSESIQRLGYQPKKFLMDGMKEFVSWAKTQPSLDLYEKSVEALKAHDLFGQAKQ